MYIHSTITRSDIFKVPNCADFECLNVKILKCLPISMNPSIFTDELILQQGLLAI